MANKKKGKREKVRLKSVESAHCYYTFKNKTNTVEKLELIKYDPILRRRAMFKEIKFPPHSKK